MGIYWHLIKAASDLISNFHSAAMQLVEVIALSSLSQMASSASHISLLLIHLDWAAQVKPIASVQRSHPGTQRVNF